MSNKKESNRTSHVLSEDQMKDALKRSGYLLEQRVEHYLKKQRYHIATENYFVDHDTKKLREIDLIAEKEDVAYASEKRKYGGVFSYKLVCECENNPHPVIFFLTKTKEPYREQGLIYSHTPYSFAEKNASRPSSLWGDTPFNSRSVIKEHHLSRSHIATQYCSFAPKDKNRPDGDWIASHLDEQHNTLTNLLKGSLDVSRRDGANQEHHMQLFYGKYQINLYYPLLILQNRLAVAHENDKGEIVIEDRDHVVYMKNHGAEGWPQLFMIDVIHERFLGQYITMIQQEVHAMHAKFLRHPQLQNRVESWEKDYLAIKTQQFMDAQGFH